MERTFEQPIEGFDKTNQLRLSKETGETNPFTGLRSVGDDERGERGSGGSDLDHDDLTGIGVGSHPGEAKLGGDESGCGVGADGIAERSARVGVKPRREVERQDRSG